MTPHPIDWELIAAAMAVYQRLGYKRIEVPWTAPLEVLEATIRMVDPRTRYPDQFISSCSGIGHMVGSAEQSILASRLDGSLGRGKYVACTPCFRPLDGFTDIHQPYFIKVELWMDTSRPEDYRNVMGDARAFMDLFVDDDVTEILHSPDLSDLVLRGIEVGSYGWREHEGVCWAYGTGIAEPRFSIARNRQ